MVGRLYHLPAGRGRAPRRRAARAPRPRRRRRPAGQDVLRRHAPPARPRRQPRRRAAGAVPRRADHRARPAQPQRALGPAARARRATAPRSCSPPSTSRRPTASPTTSSCSTTAAIAAHGTPAELKARIGGERIEVTRRRRRRARRPPPRRSRTFADGRRRGRRRRPRVVTVPVRAGTRLSRSCARSTPPASTRIDVHRREADARRRLPHPHRPATTEPTARRSPHERSRPRRAPALRWLSDSLVARAAATSQHVRQIPEKLLDVTLQPLMFVLLFAFVFGGVDRVPGGDYREYLIGGILVQSLAFGMMGPATSIATDLGEGISTASARCRCRARRTCSATSLAELAGDAAGRRRAVRSPGSSSAGGIHTERASTRSPASACSSLFAFAMLWLGTLLGRHRPLARRRPGHRLHRRVPADVPGQRVRAGRRAARRAAHVRRVEPGQRAGRRGARRCSATRPRSRPTPPWPLAAPGRQRAAVVRGAARGRRAAGHRVLPQAHRGLPEGCESRTPWCAESAPRRR